MAGNFSNQDSFDIQELATLNEDITADFLEQLQNQVAQSANTLTQTDNDGALFEEIPQQEETIKPESPAIGKIETDTKSGVEPQPSIEEPVKKEKTAQKINIDDSFDDNFIKKYKAKLNKKKNRGAVEDGSSGNQAYGEKSSDIEELTAGNIIEKPIVQEHINYNDSLDYLDENVKYSKYVIYIDPENTEFIESLTVKERKNLINKILKEQDDIAITKKRFNLVQDIIKHSIIAILTIAISIPVIYYTINSSLEASINNYRNSQSIFKSLYRERGKIQTNVKLR